MKLVKVYILAAWLCFAGNAAAQSKISIEPRLGYGTFHMESMKRFQQTALQETTINLKATDEFPPYFQFGIGVGMEFSPKINASFFLERGSTGGRLSYKDYSGEIIYDTPVNYNMLGASLYYLEPIKHSKFTMLAGIESSILMSQLKIKVYSRIFDESGTSEDKFNSFGLGIKPYVGLQYPILNIPAQLSLGYLVNMSGPFHIPGEPEYYLVINNSDEKLKPDWSGIRINLTVSIPVSK